MLGFVNEDLVSLVWAGDRNLAFASGLKPRAWGACPKPLLRDATVPQTPSKKVFYVFGWIVENEGV
ncbi:MAG TPA: hypothetical protein V6D16_02990 [Candidatus Obscuribacterales bacterium]